jgi:hypothetical protein
MQKILFVFLLLLSGLEAWPQTDTVITRYSIDTIRVDSFYLVRVDSVFATGFPRPSVSISSTLFRDTFELRQFILSQRQMFYQLDAQRLEIAKAYNRASYLVARLECLIDSVFHGAACSGAGARSVKLPPDEAPSAPAESQKPAKNKAVVKQQRKKSKN